MLPMQAFYPNTIGLPLNGISSRFPGPYPLFSAPIPMGSARGPRMNPPSQASAWTPPNRTSRPRYQYQPFINQQEPRVDHEPKVHSKAESTQEKKNRHDQRRNSSPSAAVAEIDLYSNPDRNEEQKIDEQAEKKSSTPSERSENKSEKIVNTETEQVKQSEDSADKSESKKKQKKKKKNRSKKIDNVSSAKNKKSEPVENGNYENGFRKKAAYPPNGFSGIYPGQGTNMVRPPFYGFRNYRSQPNIFTPKVTRQPYPSKNLNGWPSTPTVNNPAQQEIQRLKNHIHMLENRLHKLQKKLNKQNTHQEEKSDQQQQNNRLLVQTPVIVELNNNATNGSQDGKLPSKQSLSDRDSMSKMRREDENTSNSEKSQKSSPASNERREIHVGKGIQSHNNYQKNPNLNHSNNNHDSSVQETQAEKILDAFERFYVNRTGSKNPMKVKFIPKISPEEQRRRNNANIARLFI